MTAATDVDPLEFIASQMRMEIPIPIARADWLEARVPFFNASAAACLYDRHQFQSAAEYAVKKLTAETSDDGQTEAMRRGHFLEDAVAEMWGHENGRHVRPVHLMPVCGRIMATLDRWDDTEDRPVEIKTASGFIDEDDLPQYWLDQVQAVMLCADAGAIDLVWLDGSMRAKSTVVEADPELQADMLRRADRFMAAIDMGMVPDYITPTLEASHISALYPEPAGAIELGDEGGNLLMEFVELKGKIKRLTGEMESIKDDICRQLGEHEIGLWDGVQVVTFKKSGKSRRFMPQL